MGRAGDQHVRMAETDGGPRLLAPLDQVIHQDPESAGRAGTERLDGAAQVIDAIEPFDDHGFDAEVVTPHPLDQLGIVHPFDKQASRPGRPGGCAGYRHRA
jgi:hypothetical protein